ncbi:MAG TPA: hypothetical protein PLQ04_08900 [Lachnospiraceae bacterium]|nr:hypothetical protein [Lachnospiraceae bacterium]
MKKESLYFGILFILSTLIAGCGQNNIGSNGSDHWSATGSIQEADSSGFEELQDAKLKVEIISQDEISISFSDKLIEQLSSSVSEETDNLHNGIYLYLMKEGDLYYQIYTNEIDWTLSSQVDETIWYGETDSPRVANGQTITWNITWTGIADTVQECDSY